MGKIEKLVFDVQIAIFRLLHTGSIPLLLLYYNKQMIARASSFYINVEQFIRAKPAKVGGVGSAAGSKHNARVFARARVTCRFPRDINLRNFNRFKQFYW